MAALDTPMASFNDWLEGARLRTLPAAAAPVLIGSGAAFHLGGWSLGKSLLALAVALLLQVAVNFSNDYSDGIRGTDRVRVGPTRLTASGLVSDKTVLRAALASFLGAAVFGLILIVWSGEWWMLLVGIAAIAAAWFYTGGKNPYGYMGLGFSELFVFVFFGLVATVGTTYVQSYSAPWWLWLSASGIGSISVALLMVNNIRDIPTDAKVGKRTVAVRLGETPSRVLYVALIIFSVLAGAIALVGAGSPLPWGLGLGFFLLLASLPGAISVGRGTRGMGLLGALRNTGLYALAYGVLSGAAFAIGAAASV